MSSQHIKVRPLGVSVFIISICSIVYELIIAGISTYLLGNSILQFSLTIGLYMSAMGIGSYISKYFKEKLFDYFILVELSIGFFGGISAITLFATYAYTDMYMITMYTMIMVIGILVGLEIPLLTRIIEEYNKDIRVTISSVLSYDYLGALIGSIAFPLLLFPELGFVRTGFLIGLLNVLVAGIIIYKYNTYIKHKNSFKIVLFTLLAVLIFGFATGQYSADSIEQNLYRDQIIYSDQTPYQKIVVTKHRDDLRLYLDGNLQFSSTDEYRYHEALIHPAMSLIDRRENILILGGGDGLAVRELLKYDGIDRIDLIDIDKQMVEFCQSNNLVVDLNKGALKEEKVHLYFEDAYKFLETSKELYDFIVIDLPDPNNESLNKLYTDVFYRLVMNHLSDEGICVVQSTSPYFASEAFWCIHKTIASESDYVVPFHIQVPSFGDWGFQLFAKRQIDIGNIEVIEGSKFLNNQMIDAMFRFANDEKMDLEKIEVNRISKPILLRYYEKASNQF